MAYLPIKKLLSEYFLRQYLQEACSIIDEPISYPNPELEKIILREWEQHGNDKYDLFTILDRSQLARICNAYNIDSKGSKTDLLKRIKKEKLLEDTKRGWKIGGGIGGGIGGSVLIFLITVYGTGLDTFDFIETRLNLEQSDLNWDKIPDGVTGNRYVNKSLGFTIEKPDDTWFFITDFHVFVKEYNPSSKFEGLLGGILVAKPISHQNVAVGVLKLESTELDLKQRVENIIEITPYLWNIKIENIEKDFSPDGNYAYFAYDGINSTMQFHHGRIFKIDNGKFYEVGWVTEPLYVLPEDIKQDIDCIVKSFTTISSQTTQIESKC